LLSPAFLLSGNICVDASNGLLAGAECGIGDFMVPLGIPDV
jgi:hypothetical protein